jgi:molybdopterin converting factor subunit 1
LNDDNFLRLSHCSIVQLSFISSGNDKINKVQVKLLFFASLKDIVGSRRLQLDVPEGATVADVLASLEASYPRIKQYRSVVLTAVNEEYADQLTAIHDGDEVAIFPPVSGGEVDSVPLIIARPHELYQITRDVIDTQIVSRQLEIGIFVRQAWDIDSIAMIHRLGHLKIGETSVAVIITSAHRRAAFDACHYAIDKLKKVVPIWKKEFFEDGEIWIEGQ